MGQKRKKTHEKEPNLERWLVSYADFITLLFAVFVTLFAMSVADQQKVQEVKVSIQSAFGMGQSTAPAFKVIESPVGDAFPRLSELPVTPQASEEISYAEAEEFVQMKNEIQAGLKESGAQSKVSLTVDERGLVISLKEAGFFASGSAVVQPEALPLLDEIAGSISGYANAFRIEGHTDNVPVRSSTFPSNWELSTARATNIVHALIERHKFPGSRLSATGYGEYRPIAENTTEAGRRKNRRVDIVMLSSKGALGEP